MESSKTEICVQEVYSASPPVNGTRSSQIIRIEPSHLSPQRRNIPPPSPPTTPATHPRNSPAIGPIFGFAITSTVSTLTILYPAVATSSSAVFKNTLEAAPFHRGSLGGKNVPIPPALTAPNSASVIA